MPFIVVRTLLVVVKAPTTAKLLLSVIVIGLEVVKEPKLAPLEFVVEFELEELQFKVVLLTLTVRLPGNEHVPETYVNVPPFIDRVSPRGRVKVPEPAAILTLIFVKVPLVQVLPAP